MTELEAADESELLRMLETQIRTFLERLGRRPETEERRGVLVRLADELGRMRDDSGTDTE